MDGKVTLADIAKAGGQVAIPASVLINMIDHAVKVPAPPDGLNCEQWISFWRSHVPSVCSLVQKAEE